MRTDADLRNILIEETTPDGLISQCILTDESLPTAASKFSIGCLLTSSANGKTYRNAGTVAIPSWNDIGATTADEISLAYGSVLVGNSSGLAAALSAKGDGKILVGNGTTVTSVAVSGDATLANTGALTIGNDKVTTAKILNANVTLAKLAAGITPSHVVKFAKLGSEITTTALTGLVVGDLVIRFVADGTVTCKPCTVDDTLPDDPADTDYVIVLRAAA